MSLVYLSPVRWADFAQRPHKFAQWHHARHGGQVLWLEPYPTRLPKLADLRRNSPGRRPPGQEVPHWLQRVAVPAIPAEPVPGATVVNRALWGDALRRVRAFAAAQPTELVIGKPSRLALLALRAGGFSRTSYDAMDDFPAFHRGLSARSLARVETQLARSVDCVLASSSRLRAKFEALGATTLLVRNACDVESLEAAVAAAGAPDQDLVGYVGTIAPWFDWELVCGLARLRPDKRFLLVGPLHTALPADLPANVGWEPACAHPEAMRRMARFGAGLIPFRSSALSEAVDPVKYYEYRALGIPVLSTAFGEMTQHAQEDPGVFLVRDAEGAAQALDRAQSMPAGAEWVREFRARNSWDARFAGALTACAPAGSAKA